MQWETEWKHECLQRNVFECSEDSSEESSYEMFKEKYA